MKGALTFFNDWRDSLYYSMVAFMVGVMFFNDASARSMYDLTSQMIWLREIFRWFAWGSPSSPMHQKAAVCGVITYIDLFSDTFVHHILLGEPWGGPGHKLLLIQGLFLLIGFSVFTICYLRAGGIKVALKTYWKDMWDWPRKQKPPGQFWNTAARKIIDAMEKFRPNFIPSPAGC